MNHEADKRAAYNGEIMNQVKITVLRVCFFDDLVAKYGAPDYQKCERHEEGQVFYCNGWQKPAGFCDNAWACIRDFVFALAHGAGYVYGKGQWCSKPGLVVASCNDGLKPVIFKLESTDLLADTYEDLHRRNAK